MTMPTKPQVIALEEHYLDPELATHFKGLDAVPPHGAVNMPKVPERLYDLGALRIKEMDEAGVDFQVLSHAAPSLQKVDGETGVRLAKSVNDRLHQTVLAHPDRFAAFAALPTADPKGAADELERTVTKLGFKGAMIHGLTNGLFIDDTRFWPIFERARALDVPLYMHPSIPDPRVIEVYYKDYIEKFPTILRAAWGFTVETATQGVRLVLSGLFEKYPGLKIILGHLGEGLPLYLWRINMGFARDGRGPTWFRDVFSEHFWVTTSGFFSDPALLHCIQELGIDRVLFSIDYPFVDNPPGTSWAERLPVAAADKEKILNGNAKRLLKL
jgi:predicted TIM-barrel fold metal-dependent hydrolase